MLRKGPGITYKLNFFIKLKFIEIAQLNFFEKIVLESLQKVCYLVFTLVVTCHGVVVLLQASKQKISSSKLYRNIADICQQGHPEFKVLCCSSNESGSKASVLW